MDNYPEHEKLTQLAGANETLGSFLEWASAKGWRIMEWRTVNVEYSSGLGDDVTALVPVQLSTQQMLADFFEIDLAKLEQEKQQMLAALATKA